MVTPKRASAAALAVVVAIAAYVAVNLHRRGHTTGDDFALYLRQAQSLFEGNIAQVISDNRLLWANSTGVTPQMYPWGFPVLLAPFVRVFGLDYGRLKLVEVACLCVWLVLFHGIVRRRTGRIVALAVTAVFATAPIYLLHTDQLLTEFPHMMAVAVVIWWLDRVILRHRLTTGADERPRRARAADDGRLQLPAREHRVPGRHRRDPVRRRARRAQSRRRSRPAVAVAARAATRSERCRGRRCRSRTCRSPPAAPSPSSCCRRRSCPTTATAEAFITTRLFNLNDPGQLPEPAEPRHRRRGTAATIRGTSCNSSGSRSSPVFGLIIICLALAGAVIACAKSPRLNVPLAVLMVTTMLVIGTHFRMVARYYFQVTPLIVLFVTILLVTAAREIAR